jgi:hypothetical protein
VPTLTVHLRHLPHSGTPAASHLTIPTTHRQRYPTAYPPPLPTKLVNAFRTIARISHQLLRTHLRQRFGEQMASRAFVITRRPAYLHTELCAPAQARGHADCELPFRHCTPCPHHHMRAVPSLMPIASCDFVIARPLGILHTAREQVATQHQPRNRDIVLPPLTSARLVVGTAGSRFPNRDIVLASLTSASPVVGTAGG